MSDVEQTEDFSPLANLAAVYDAVDDDPEEEDGPGIDYRFDDDKGAGKRERKIIGVLRTMVADVVAGGAIDDLVARLEKLFGRIEQAVKACQAQAKKRPDQAAFYAANIVAYSATLDAIEDMDEALEDDGDTSEVLLEKGLSDFVMAVDEIDRLVAEEAAELERAKQEQG